MGILNVTPDSFASAPLDAEAAVREAVAMVEAGADIIDVGGESTRPGASPVGEEEERRRVIPVVRALARRIEVPISVDTYKASIARAAFAEGASLVNDVSGLQYDPALAEVAASTGAPLILMHTRGRSSEMYSKAEYGDVVAEVCEELSGAVDRATRAGVPREQLVLDPGIGFAKRPGHSYGVLARVGEIAAALDRPLLLGPSRKSFMAEALNHRPPVERDWGTAAAVAAAVLGGAHLLRVHAVAAMVDVARVAEEIRRHGLETT